MWFLYVEVWDWYNKKIQCPENEQNGGSEKTATMQDKRKIIYNSNTSEWSTDRYIMEKQRSKAKSKVLPIYQIY